MDEIKAKPIEIRLRQRNDFQQSKFEKSTFISTSRIYCSNFKVSRHTLCRINEFYSAGKNFYSLSPLYETFGQLSFSLPSDRSKKSLLCKRRRLSALRFVLNATCPTANSR